MTLFTENSKIDKQSWEGGAPEMLFLDLVLATLRNGIREVSQNCALEIHVLYLCLSPLFIKMLHVII